MKTVKKLTAGDQVALVRYFDEHLKRNEDGSVAFEGDASDKEVADLIGANPASVASFRRRAYGEIQPKRGRPLSARIVELENKVVVLTRRLDAMDMRVEKFAQHAASFYGERGNVKVPENNDA